MFTRLIIVSLLLLILSGCAHTPAVQATAPPPMLQPTSLPTTAPPTLPLATAPPIAPLAATVRPAADIAAEIDTFISTVTEKGMFNGFVLVDRDGGVIFSKGYGLADREKQTPITGRTRFYIGSLTKQFAAAAIMLLEEEGKLSVQDSMCQHLPQCPAAWQPITIHHLLTHTAGLPDSLGLPYTRPATPAELRTAIEQLPLLSKPGARFEYSDAGYILAGLIMEQVSGQPYGEFLQERIFNPAGMADSGYGDGGEQLAVGYLYAAASTKSPPFEPTRDYAAGGVYSTAEDLLRWDQALYADTPLTAASRERLFTPYTVVDEAEYGYGWFITGEPDHRLISHGGSGSGFQTELACHVDDQVTIIVLANQDTASPPAITRQIFRII